MKTQPDIEALQQLIRVLQDVEQLPEERFNMSYYRLVPRRGCGTVKCAYGWALSDAWFLQRHNIEWEGRAAVRGIVYVPVINGEYEFIAYNPHGRVMYSTDRDTVFGLTQTQFNELFMPTAYEREDVRPRHVIARVEELLAELAAATQEKDNG